MKKYLLLFVFIGASIMTFAQNDEVTLMVSSDGPTKDEAVKTALRSAIEQAYGTFVSATTEILNDELVKDEIITVTQGNIKNYNEVACYQQDDGRFFVTLQATVSISKLVSYAQSKGAKTEFAGASFAMNLKMKQFNKENEEKMIFSVIGQMKNLFNKGFDYSIEINNVTSKGVVNAKLNVNNNPYALLAWQLFNETLKRLSLTNNEIQEYRNLDLEYWRFDVVMRSGTFNEISKGIYTLRSKESLMLINNFFTYTYYVILFNIDLVTNIKTSSIRIAKAAKYRYSSTEKKYLFPDSFNMEDEKAAHRLYACDYETAHYNGSSWVDGLNSSMIFYAYTEDLNYLNCNIEFLNGYGNIRRLRQDGVRPSANPIAIGVHNNKLVLYRTAGNVFDFYVNMEIPMEDLSKITSFEIKHIDLKW